MTVSQRPQYWLELWNHDGPVLGSDGCQCMDRRLSLHSVIDEGYARSYNLRHVQQHLTAFRVLSGERPSTARPVTQMISLRHQS